jgi:hypothetical protein
MSDVHITQINDTESNIRTNIDAAQIAILTDGDEDFVWENSAGSKLYYAAAQYYYDGSTTYLDSEFDDITSYGNMYAAEYIYHQGDTDTFVRFQSDQISLSVGGAETLDLNDVSGLKLTGSFPVIIESDDAAGIQLYSDTGNAYTDRDINIIGYSNDDSAGSPDTRFEIRYDESESLFKIASGAHTNNHIVITTAGLIGLGTATNTTYKLDIEAGSSSVLRTRSSDGNTTVTAGWATALFMENSNATANNGSKIRFRNSNPSDVAFIAGINVDHTASPDGQIALGTSASGTVTEAVRIDQSQRTGLSDTSPESRLTIQGTTTWSLSSTQSGQDEIFIKGNTKSAGDGNYGPSIGFGQPGSSGDQRRVAIATIQSGSDADVQGLAFLTHPSSTGGDDLSSSMEVEASGNVSIPVSLTVGGGQAIKSMTKILKAADESFTSTTLADVTSMSQTIDASEEWCFKWIFKWSSNAGGLSVSVNGSNSASDLWFGIEGSGFEGVYDNKIDLATGSGSGIAVLYCWVKNGGSSSTITLRASKQNGTAGDPSINEGAFLECYQG